MNKNIKVSVIIPVYNSEKDLKTCLESVFNSTLKEIQVICVNDGSSDSSEKVLLQMKEKYNLEIINIKNSGASYARNIALDKVQGEFIAFVDSDDTVPADYFQVLYNEAIVSNADIVMTGFNFVTSKIIPFKKYEEGVYTKFIDKFSKLVNGATWDKLFKTSLLQSNNIRFEVGRMWEDNLFLLQAIYYSKIMKIINEPRYNYRINPESVTRKEHLIQKRKEDALYIYKKSTDFAIENDFSKEELRVLIYFLRYRALRGYI